MCLRIKQYFAEKKARKEVLLMDDFTIDEKVKIQGTNHDRKRKYSFEFFQTLKMEYQAGASLKDLATRYNMNVMTIRYNIDPEFRLAYNAKRKKGTHAVGQMDFNNRVAYKRNLIKTKQISAVEVL